MTRISKAELEGLELSGKIDDVGGVGQFMFYNVATERSAFLELDLATRTFSACISAKRSDGTRWLPLDAHSVEVLKSKLSKRQMAAAIRMAMLYRPPT